MDFDGAMGKKGVGIGIWIHNPINQSLDIPPNVRMSSYKLAFDFTNNEDEYERLNCWPKFFEKAWCKENFCIWRLQVSYQAS